MANKEYVSIFVLRETRDKLKIKTTQVGYPSMVSLLEALSEKTSGEIRQFLSKLRVIE